MIISPYTCIKQHGGKDDQAKEQMENADGGHHHMIACEAMLGKANCFTQCIPSPSHAAKDTSKLLHGKYHNHTSNNQPVKYSLS